MDDSKRSILNMLAEGRISLSEAERLLDELEKNRKVNMHDKLKEVGKNLEEMADDLNDRFEELSKEYSPKIKKAVEEAGKKTSDILEDLSKEINNWFK
ncbi:SHOCT-like domain-containing protein [Vallitalea okinawensis]|uniref:SHOCT-like domain-containing protein n=1 Tax=Vallitalea okinawensis TaxID=2078660 RepID=UPI000CFCF4B6|nr:hypothetical protein [Vallitalea okinawensis]